MEKERFSKEELYALRNKIPVKRVIEDILLIPNKTSEGIFRFLCPQCNEFDTRVSEQENLCRCFRCNKSFNPIDIVISSKGYSFVESVKFLRAIITNQEQVMQLVADTVDQLLKVRSTSR